MNNFLLARDKVMFEMSLRQLRYVEHLLRTKKMQNFF